MIGLNITKSGADWRCILPDMMHWEEHSTCVLFLPKTHKWNLTMRKYQTLKWETFSQKNKIQYWPVLFKNVKVIKDKEIIRDYSRQMWIQSKLLHLPAMWRRAGHFPSVCLSFIIYKRALLISSFFFEDEDCWGFFLSTVSGSY